MWLLYSPSQIQAQPFYLVEGFTEENINSIIEIGQKLPLEEAGIINGETDQAVNNKDVRITEVGWIIPEDESEWLYRALTDMVLQVNHNIFKYNIQYIENLQYTVYNGASKSFYGFHTDTGPAADNNSVRKITVVIQLSDPSEYEGGDLIILDRTGKEVAIDKKKGLAVIFDSRTLHKVTPVTSGTRKTLVAWVNGPSFI